MDYLLLTLILLLGALSGTVIWWMLRNEARIRLLQIDLAADRVELRSGLSRMESSIGLMNLSSEALLQSNPENQGTIAIHTVLKKIEAQIDAGLSDSNTAAATAKELHSAIRMLLKSVELEGDLCEEPQSIQPGALNLTDRLFSLLNSMDIDAKSLGFNTLEYAKLGELFYRCGHLEWARLSYQAAIEKSPGHTASLSSLTHLAKQEGNVELQLDWIEKMIEHDPDNSNLLRSHASLVIQTGVDEERAERDMLRLEAMGEDTPADQSLLSGLRSRSGSPQEAIERLEKILEAEPNRADDWFLKSEMHVQLSEHDNALISVEEAIRANRQFGDAWALKAKLLADNPLHQEDALRAARHAVALNAGGTELILLKANLIALEEGEISASETLQSALDTNPNNDELRSHIADLLRQSGDLFNAEKLLNAATIKTYKIYIARARIQLVYADMKRDGTGETDEVYISIAKHTFENAIDLNRESGIAWLGIARCERLLKNFEIAKEALDRASRLLEGEPSVDAESALLALDIGDLVEANRLIDSAAIGLEETAIISYLKGNLSCMNGNFIAARNHFDDVLERHDPLHVRARLNRIAASLALGLHDSAMDDCRVLLEHAPELTLAKCRMADIFMLVADWATAKELWLEILEVNANHPHALTQLAACNITLGNPDQAEAPLNKAIRLDPNFAPAWHNRGLLYLEWAEEEAAIQDFETTIKVDPKHIDARLHLASIHHSAGRWKIAAPLWRNVLDIDSDNDVARQRLSHCEMQITTISK
jgi:tetratricopeptide (TPR) repeat protein